MISNFVSGQLDNCSSNSEQQCGVKAIPTLLPKDVYLHWLSADDLRQYDSEKVKGGISCE